MRTLKMIKLLLFIFMIQIGVKNDAGKKSVVLLLNNAGEKAYFTPFLKRYLEEITCEYRGAVVRTIPCFTSLASLELSEGEVKAIVISGSSSSVIPLQDLQEQGPATSWNISLCKKYKQAHVLGICYGMQALAVMYGGQLKERKEGLRQSIISIYHHSKDDILVSTPCSFKAQVSHRHYVHHKPPKFTITAFDSNEMIMGFSKREGKRIITGIQYHPEAPSSQPAGKILLTKFLDTALSES